MTFFRFQSGYPPFPATVPGFPESSGGHEDEQINGKQMEETV